VLGFEPLGERKDPIFFMYFRALGQIKLVISRIARFSTTAHR
jgi:hypothetical protein